MGQGGMIEDVVLEIVMVSIVGKVAGARGTVVMMEMCQGSHRGRRRCRGRRS